MTSLRWAAVALWMMLLGLISTLVWSYGEKPWPNAAWPAIVGVFGAVLLLAGLFTKEMWGSK